jgi:predicted thioesterase
MRPGPPRGATATLDVEVTADMAAHAISSPPVAVCGTAALGHLVERICREMLEPHLESDEEGVGTALELAYRVPVPVGEMMNLTATVAVVGPTKLVCEVLVRHAGQNVARGSCEQQVVSSSSLRQELESRRTAPE